MFCTGAQQVVGSGVGGTDTQCIIVRMIAVEEGGGERGAERG